MILTALQSQLDAITNEHAGTPHVREAVLDVEDKVASNRRIQGWGASWEKCVDWSAADAGAIARARFDYSCQGWAEDLRGSLLRLSSALRVADDWSRAEVISSIADETTTAVEQSSEVVGSPTLWAKETPWWVYAGVAAGALLAWKAVE